MSGFYLSPNLSLSLSFSQSIFLKHFEAIFFDIASALFPSAIEPLYIRRKVRGQHKPLTFQHVKLSNVS